MSGHVINWTNAIRVALLVLVAAVASCGDGDSAKKPGGASEPPDELSQWAIQVYVGDGADRKLVKFPPVKEISFGSATDAVLQAGASADGKASPAKRTGLPTAKPGKSVSKGDQQPSKSSAPSSKQKALIEGDDGGVNVEQELSMPSGWALVYGAAAECGMVPEMGGPPDTFLLNEAVVPPWSALSGGGTAWSIFQRRPVSCSEQLQQNETLLCIAAELNALSQAIAPVRWEKVADAPPLPGVPPGPWTLKPQANRDRFIFRDLAIYMLATLAVNDTWPIARFTETGDGSCSKVFVKAIDDYTGFAEPNAEWIFGKAASEHAPYFPPEDLAQRLIDQTNVPNLATTRLKFQTQILRSASRLLDELIDTSVEADLAGAAMRRAKATDPLRGAQIAWGDRNNDNGPYNTLAHALRVVMGRWELSPAVAQVEWYTTDPKCGTVATEDLLEQAFGADRDARIEDIAIRTKGQELATQIVEKAGIVIPTTQLANTASVRAAVKAQLVGKEAVANGLLPADPQVAEIGLDRSVQFVLDDLSDADLNFALTRTFTQYRVLNTAPAVTSVVTPGGGLVPDSFVAPELGGVNGIALKDGIPRQDMEIDVMSRVAGIQNAIQCDEYFGANGLLNADWAVRTSFQDSYSLGQALARRLVVLRESVRASTGLAGEVMDELLDTSEKAAAEAQLWSGEGRIVATSDPSMSVGGIEEVVFYTLGFQPKDFAVSNVTDMAGQLILAYGEPWVADCAARLRNNCPANLNDYLLTTPSFTLNADLTDAERLYTGHDGTVGLWRFPTSGQFTPTYFPGESPTTLPTKFVYVILKNDPDSPAGKGKVLGSIALRQPDLINNTPTGGTNIVVSDKQRRHLNDILGFKRIGNTHLGPESLSAGPAYCIEGVPKNLFVPLENELTSDSDEYENSWRHYLSLARQAAERADSLGKELIDLGLQTDFRREAAGENLAQICGDYAALDKIKVDKGQVSAEKPAKDKALEACLGEDKVPLVFITEDPTLFEADKVAFLRAKLGCGGDYDSELCKLSDAELNNLKVEGLNLAEYVPESATGAASKCDEINNAVATLPTSFAGDYLKTFAAQPWISKTALTELTKRLKVRVDVDTSNNPYWALELSLTTIMNSLDTAAWPGCRRPGQTCAVEDDAKLYDRLFRRTPPGTQLGGGPDGNVDEELNAILWRVQGAVWNLGALSGSVEAGLFDVQLPAANFTGPGQRAPLFTLYGPSRFINFELGFGVAPEEREAVGTAADIPAGMTWPQNAGIPSWLVELSAEYASGQYLRVGAENRSRKGFGVSDIPVWLADALGKLNGIACGDPAGGTRQFGATPGTATAAHFQAAVALNAMRAGKDWGEICKSQGFGYDVLALRRVSEDVYDSVFRDLLVNQTTDLSGVGITPKHWTVLHPYPQGGPTDVDLLIYNAPGQITFPADTTDSGLFGYLYPLPSCRHQKYGKFGIPSAAGEPGIHEVTDGCAISMGQVFDQPFILGKPPGKQATICNDPNVCRSLGYQRTTLSLMPRSCPKANRVELFINSYPAPSTCGAATQLAQTMALACNIGTGSVLGAVSGRPELTKLSDLEGFTRWVDQLSKDAARQASNIYLEGLPRRVVEAFNQKKVGGEAFKGDHGVKLLELRGSLEGLAGGWNRVSGNLAQLHEAIKSAQISIQGAKISQEQAMVAFAMQRLSIHASMLHSASGAIGGFSVGSLGGGTIAGLTNAGIGLSTGAAQLEKVKEGEKLAASAQGNAVSAALNQLQLVSGPLYTDLQNALGDIRASASTVLAIVEQIRQSERQAQYEAAKGSGADYVEIDGQKVPFPVNTVQRRLYDATNLRYQEALKEAKYLSYVARLAIEQRLGVRLQALPEAIGPIEAPAKWADDVCSLTGVDYTKLSTFVDPDGGTPTEQEEKDIIAEFADQYIGDYVTKLEGFVEYYNIKYPSHDGDDTTVLSLRDDLLGPPQACTVEAPNMLYYSSDLAGYDFIDVGGTPTARGWQLTPCDATGTTCLRVDRSNSLEISQTAPATGKLPVTAAGGDFSWLHDFASSGTVVDAGADGGAGPEGGIATVDLPRTVAQTVTLTAGASYVLSWWDQARAPDGTLLPATSTGVQYSATVLAPDGSVAGSFVGAPFVPDPNPPDAGPAAQAWSERRAIGLTATQSGDYKVVFAASAFPNELGSVLIASVQLEEAPPASLPGPYFDVKSTRLIASSNCGGLTKEDVQAAFRYACDTNNQCFYELVSPLVFDTGNLGAGDSRLTGKLAADNFNFRHITVAVNLVGTGVYDCSNNPTQSCFSKAYVDYTLDHDAFQVSVLSWTGPKDKQIFNFGSAAINHGKALAAERYITLPVGSADQALLSQAGVRKPEYRGRPLDGSYRFRVWDSPQLRWNRLEDIQLVLQYRYWSPIQPQAGQ